MFRCQQLFVAIAVTVAVTPGPASIAEETPPPAPVISGPAAAFVGSLVVLDATESRGDYYSWLVDTSGVTLPPVAEAAELSRHIAALRAAGLNVLEKKELELTPTHIVIDSGRKLILSSFPGTYRVILAVSVDGVGVAQAVHTVTIRRATPGPPPTFGFGLAAQVPAWLATVPAADRGDAAAIGKGLKNIAAIAGSDILPDIQSVKTALLATLTISIKNKKSWREFGTAFANEIDRLLESGKISTPKQYGQALGEVGGAL